MINESADGDEDGDESSSPYRNMSNQFKSALDEFREKWQQELKADTTDSSNDNNETIPTKVDEDDRIKAEGLFMQGVELERRGKVYDALRYYRRAVQLVPDIEFRIYESTKKGVPIIVNNNANERIDSDGIAAHEGDDDENEDLSNENLFARFQAALVKEGKLIQRSVSDSKVLATETHISDLPMELILYIFRWVVSSQLDFRSLEQCAACCKGLYLCSRDQEIWRLACLKVWGVNIGVLANTNYTSWRQMFIERPRVHFNGCYISKTSYLRYGENSFQDQFYRPVQLIEYYRYIRFFPDGIAVMMTSADDPAQAVGKLKNIEQYRSELLRGHYRLHGDLVIIVLKRNQKPHGNNNKRRPNSELDGTNVHTLYIEIQIVSTPKRRFAQLQWKHYSIIQVKNKREVTTDFDLSPAKYPPLWFSRVKSYHLEAETPLQ